MQNWMHLTHVMKHFNLQPREAHDCDFSRVREWAAEGRSKYYRQTILLSHTPNKLENLLLFQNSFNHRGWIELKSKNSNSQLANIPQPVPQLFHRLRLDSHCYLCRKVVVVFGRFLVKTDLSGSNTTTRHENRLKAFKKMIHDLTKAKLSHILIYIPSYFDYIVIRNFMFETDTKFVSCNEYSGAAEIKRCRNMFESGEMPIMLLTERR